MTSQEVKEFAKHKFKEPFRKRKPWSMPPDWKQDIDPTAPRLDPTHGA